MNDTNLEKVKKKRRFTRRKYKKLNKKEVSERRTLESKSIKINENNSEYKISKAGNEGNLHVHMKLKKAEELYEKYKDKIIYEEDGVWFEYPIISEVENLTKYNENKLNYLLSLYEPIEIKNSRVKNLHNIFNSNLKSKLRGRKSLKALNIKKIVDIAVVINKKIIYIAEVVVSNKLTATQKHFLQEISFSGGFEFEII